MRIAHIAAAGAAAAALTLGAALPASADSSPAATGTLKADRAKVEVFKHPKFKGKHTTFTRSVPNLAAIGWDHIGSAKNVGKRTVTFYEHTGYQGARFSLTPGEKDPHFGDHPHMSDGPASLHFH